jgi:quinolinate synthase
MADMTTPERIDQLRSENPGAVVVCYVNSTAEVKAHSDICCTSSNAEQVVESVPEDRPVVFVPDQYLGQFVAQQTGRQIILDRGYCPTHVRIRPEGIAELKRLYPEAEVIVHPECRPEVTAMADVVTSTGGMVRRARESRASVMIVGTEVGLLYRLREENPEKEFLTATPAAVCENMKRVTPEKVLWALQELEHRVRVPEGVREPARRAIERMLSIGVREGRTSVAEALQN